MDLLCDVSLPRRIALRCMVALSSTGFSLCTVDRPQLKPQAEACATGARRTCAVAARGKTGRKLPQSSCEKCGLKSLCGNSAPAPCSAHLQVSMCLNLQCPPEGGLYKSAQKPRCHSDAGGQTLRDREAGRVCVVPDRGLPQDCLRATDHSQRADEFLASERDKQEE